MCNPNKNLHGKSSELKAELQALRAENVKLKQADKIKLPTPKKQAIVSPKTCEATRYFLKHEDVLN